MDDTELIESDSIAMCLGLTCRLRVSKRASRMLQGIEICDAVSHLMTQSKTFQLLKGRYRSLIKNRAFTVTFDGTDNAVYVRYGVD